MRTFFFAAILLLSGAALASGQETVRLVENFPPGYQYRVSCRVTIEGTLRVAGEKDKPAENLKIVGKSVIEYHERVLTAGAGKVDKTVRRIRQMDFTRQVGDVEQENKLRPSLNLLVVLRHQHLEVPFSPQGPLLWSEIDLVRTDVFTPALAGLLPRTPVKAGDRWTADARAVHELTDLEHLDKGSLACRFEGLNPANRALARVSFQGTIRGVGEDGPAEHELDGYLYFDLDSQHLSYVSLEGKHRPLDKAGLPQGEVKGSFVLTRDPGDKLAELQDDSLARWNLEPNENNTLLLYESPEVKFLYPRHWRIGGVNGRQITLDERGGSGLLVTLEPPAKVPTAVQFQQEVQGWLGQQKARLIKASPARSLQANPFPIDHFSVEAQINGQALLLDYYVLRQSSGGATLSGRYLPAQAGPLQRDVERIAKSMALTLK
jgi:hypothetical protein